MNRDPVTAILSGALIVSVMLTAGLCYTYLHVSQNNQQAQRQVALLNARRNLMQPLAAECLEFSRKHPSIIPVLQSLGVRSRTGETNVSAIIQQGQTAQPQP
jgi:hypothetical protein